MSKEEIIEKINLQLPMLKSRYGVKRIGVFGSVARDEAEKKSDIDIAVEFESPTGFFEFIRLEKFLSDLLSERVDLITFKAIKPVIKDDILREMIYV